MKFYILLTYLLHGAESFLRSQLVLHLVKKFPAFYEILYLSIIFRKYVNKIQRSLKSDKNKEYFT
jgi:predicted DNA-binding protein (UPF0278 family)